MNDKEFYAKLSSVLAFGIYAFAQMKMDISELNEIMAEVNMRLKYLDNNFYNELRHQIVYSSKLAADLFDEETMKEAKVLHSNFDVKNIPPQHNAKIGVCTCKTKIYWVKKES